MFRVHCAVLNPQPPGEVTGSQRYGGHGERETPGLIPNPEAKPPSADGTAPETGWESRTPPDNHSRTGPRHQAAGPFGIPPALHGDKAPALDGDKARGQGTARR